MAGAAPLINRYLRLRKEVLDPLDAGLSFEGLIDAVLCLYEHCNSKDLKNQHQIIADFVNKFQGSINKYHKLRVSIDDFDVKRIIGRGNFADVKLSKEKCSGNVYALKVMKKSNGGKNTALYEEERNIMAKTTSPWLTKLDYAFQDAKYLYLAMEFHAGGDFLSLLDKFGHKLEEKAIRFYVAEIVLGIHDLHKMGYVHRDIKPENLLLDLTGHIKIADFGSSAPLNSSGLVTKAVPVGTPEYIAPEVLQCLQNSGESHGRECDYWSVGILAYEMMYGTTPFSDLDGSVLKTYSNIMGHDKVQFPSTENISKNLKDLIEGLLKTPSKRYTYKQIIHHSFFGDIDWSNMKNVTPPHVPQVKGSDDASNFDVIEEELNIDTSSLKDSNKLGNLPFIGFTFTADKGKVKSLDRKENNCFEEELKTKATELERFKIRCHQLEQQVMNQTKVDETCQRDFEAAEKLTNELGSKEQDVVRLKAECQNLHRVLEVERQDRAAIEHKTLQVLEDVRKKWAKNEEVKLDKLRGQLKEEQEKCEHLETELHSTKRDLKSNQTELESVKGVKGQLKKKLQDYKQRLENAIQLETKTSQSVKKLEDENQKLKDTLSETTSSLNASRITESKIEKLESQIAEKDEEISLKESQHKIKIKEVETLKKQQNEDKAKITDMESNFKKILSELDNLKKDYDEHLEKQQEQAVSSTVAQIRTELTDKMKEVNSLRQELQEKTITEEKCTKELNKLKEKMKNMKESMEKLKREKLDISLEKRRLEGDISDFERKIARLEKERERFEEEKSKMATLQSNSEIMKDALIDLNRQITEAERDNEVLQEKITRLETENRDAVNRVDKIQEDLRKARIATNEEKSAKLFAEQKMKVNESRLEDQEKEAARNKEFYDKNLSEYKDLCKKLSDTLEDLTGKNVKMESQISQTTKVKSFLEIENDQLKKELTEKITQLQSHKESNFKLTQGMEEAINKIESKNKELDNLNLKIDSDSRAMSEQVTKHEGTIAQQTKLIDFLQAKVEEQDGRKKTFADNLKGSGTSDDDDVPVISPLRERASGGRRAAAQAVHLYKGKEDWSTDVFKCDNCQTSFASDEVCKLHTCTDKGRVFTNSKDKNIFKCELCGKILKGRRDLNQHKDNVHFKVKLFACPHCDKRYGQKYVLNEHITRVHDNVRFNCDVCGKDFGKKSHLNTHKNNVHEKTYKYNCKYCVKGVKFKTMLDTHMRVHHPMELEIEKAEFLDSNPAVCDKCQKRFPNNVHLHRHIKNLHKIESGIQ